MAWVLWSLPGPGTWTPDPDPTPTTLAENGSQAPYNANILGPRDALSPKWGSLGSAFTVRSSLVCRYFTRDGA